MPPPAATSRWGVCADRLLLRLLCRGAVHTSSCFERRFHIARVWSAMCLH